MSTESNRHATTTTLRQLALALLAVVALAPLAGCAESQTRDTAGSGGNDSQIASAVRHRLFDLDSNGAGHIQVSSIDGVVYLHGLVTTSVERSNVVSAAGNVPGVVRVVDSMELGAN